MNKLSAEELNTIIQAVVGIDEEVITMVELLLDSDSCEEETLIVETLLESRKKRICIRDFFECIVPSYSEKEFMTHFRIKKSVFKDLAMRYEASENFQKHAEDKQLGAEKSMAMFLWFAGHEACAFRDLADRFNVPLSAVSKIINRVSMFVSNLSPNVITWPNDTEKHEASEFFKNKAGFSKAFGCIGGTHIQIDPPSKNRHDYIDRKGNTSVILQAICNEKRQFISFFVGYPGSCHDSWVYSNSPVSEKLRTSCGDYYLLGDSEYPCTKNLLTPYKDNRHLTTDQKFFNMKLNSCHVLIEHSFDILKQRFRQLYYCKLRGMRELCHFIRACCVLHNIAGEDDLNFLLENEIQEVSQSDLPYGETSEGNAVRDSICMEISQRNTI